MNSDITIIGAGVIGLAIAAEVAHSRLNVYILEKNDSYGTGISSRNSEVIHAGIYYPPDSLKAKLCVEGRKKLYALCSNHNIPHLKIGKLIIATTQHEMAEIEELSRIASQNDVSFTLLDQKQVNKLEPNIKAVGALHSPDTGIISAHALMDYYLSSAKKKGVELVCGTRVVAIDRLSRGYKVTTINRAGERYEFGTDRIINAAGLCSDEIAAMIGRQYRVFYCKGDYFSICNVKKGTVRRLVYPVPEKKHIGLGVHLTLDLSGRMKLGPDATYIDRVENFTVDKTKSEKFFDAAARFLPFIRKEDIIPDMCGIRPKLQGPGEEFRDFVIREDLPGFINLVGIESPGLTAAPAIAEYVKGLIRAKDSSSN